MDTAAAVVAEETRRVTTATSLGISPGTARTLRERAAVMKAGIAAVAVAGALSATTVSNPNIEGFVELLVRVGAYVVVAL